MCPKYKIRAVPSNRLTDPDPQVSNHVLYYMFLPIRHMSTEIRSANSSWRYWIFMLDTSHHPGGKQLPTWQLDFPFYPASEGKHQLTTSNLTERSVSQTPAVTPLGHTYASVPMLPSPEHCGVERGECDGGATIKTDIHPFLFFSPPFCSLYKFPIGPFWSLTGDGCSRIYCRSILRGEGYPESCERDHFCQPLIFSASPLRLT